jgi:hypothetical protein
MLSCYQHDRASSFCFKLAGALAGKDVAELEQCWIAASSTLAGRAFVVDLSELTAVDEFGRDLLSQWHTLGAEFVAKSAWSRSLVESITGYALPPVLPDRPPALAWLTFRGAPIPWIALVTLLFPLTVWAASSMETGFTIAQPAPSPRLLLTRYAAALSQTEPRPEWRTVAIEIKASPRGRTEHGLLQAIRNWVSLDSEHRLLQIKGDQTVRQQVIARYLSAVSETEAIPLPLLAVSAANYKFHFLQSIGVGRTLTYVFRITPRRNRVGFIQGELWIDVASAIAVRKAGRMVKEPAAFLRVDVSQDTDIRKGRPYRRITHMDIDTRLAGPAELTIVEHP